MTDLSGWHAFGLLALCFVIVVSAGAWWIITKLAEQGDKRAQDLQKQIELVRDMIPIDKVRGLVKDAQLAAKNTETPLDDLVTGFAAELIKDPSTTISAPPSVPTNTPK